jgi:hypothetical protein
MNALEHEIIQKYLQLDREARQRVRTLIDQQDQADASAFDFDSWLRDAETLRKQMRGSQDGTQPPIDVVGVLRDIRDGVDE